MYTQGDDRNSGFGSKFDATPDTRQNYAGSRRDFRVNAPTMPAPNHDQYTTKFKVGSNQDLDDANSAKSKPFRIKDMSGGDYMNNTGISTTTSNHTNNTGGTGGTVSRRENNDRRKYFPLKKQESDLNLAVATTRKIKIPRSKMNNTQLLPQILPGV